MSDADPLLRLVYTSRSLATPAQQADELRDIARVARTVNALRHVGGALLAANGHYLHLLEGPRSAVEALFETILLDARHTEVDLLKLEVAERRDFEATTFALVERNEIAGDTTERVRELRSAPQARAADFLRLFSVPRVSRPSQERGSLLRGVRNVVFASPGGLWAASVIGHMAAVAGDRVGRSTLTALADNGEDNRALVEYADLVVPGLGAVRGVSLARPHTSASPLFERVALIVLIVTASDAADAQAHLQDWARLPQVQHANPSVLVASSLSAERLDELAQALRSSIWLNVSTVAVKPHDAAAVWAAAQAELRTHSSEATSTAFAPTTAASEFASTTTNLSLPAVYPLDELTTRAAVLPAPGLPGVSPPEQASPDPMRRLRELPGFRGACRFRTEPLALLEREGAAPEVRHLALARWVAAQQALAGQLGIGGVEDLVLGATGETIVCRPLRDGSWLDAIVPADGPPLAAVRAALAAAASDY